MKKSCFYYVPLLLFIFAFSQQSLSQSITLTPSNFNGFNISCAGLADGSINMTITGGTPPYTIRWSNDATTEDQSGLPAGYYVVEVDDSDSLTDVVFKDIMLTQPEPLQIGEIRPYVYQNGYNISDFGSCNGSVNYDVVGGVLPYSYIWEPSQQTIQYPTNLCAYENVVIVSDANGCSTNSGIGLSEPQRDDWTMYGNSNSNPSNQFIGTLDNQDLNFRTNNIERLSIKANGNLNIPSLASNTIIYSSVVADSIGNLFVSKFKTTCLAVWSSDLIMNTITAHCPNANIKVGIGTRYPIFDLEVFKETSLNADIRIKCQTQVNKNVEMWTINTTGSYAFALDANGYGHIYRDVINPTSIMSFDYTGRVGIGLDPPSTGTYKLYVEGGIAAREVKVTIQSPFPDYVFARNYKLMSLYELEQYIKENKRLPEMPSAKEVEKNNGFEVGDIVIKLVKQNEEQALYLIEQQKQIDELKLLVKKLERRN